MNNTQEKLILKVKIKKPQLKKATFDKLLPLRKTSPQERKI